MPGKNSSPSGFCDPQAAATCGGGCTSPPPHPLDDRDAEYGDVIEPPALTVLAGELAAGARYRSAFNAIDAMTEG